MTNLGILLAPVHKVTRKTMKLDFFSRKSKLSFSLKKHMVQSSMYRPHAQMILEVSETYVHNDQT